MNKYKLLADKILEILGEGILLSDEVVQYIDSTFSNPTIEELGNILQDDSDCEKDSLVELLFFPDEQLQCQVEDLLESKHFIAQDRKIVSALLCRNPLMVAFKFPDKKESFNLEIPETVAYQFVKRLNISKQIDPNLLVKIKKNTTAKLQNRFAVKLRNSRFTLTNNGVRFLSTFFEKRDAADRDAFKYVDFILFFLEELPEEADIFETLMKMKRFYLKHLKRAEKFEEQLQKTNMETLMLKGKIAAYMDKNEAREKMDLIDRISRTVFGKTEYPELQSEDVSSIKFRSDQDGRPVI